METVKVSHRTKIVFALVVASIVVVAGVVSIGISDSTSSAQARTMTVSHVPGLDLLLSDNASTLEVGQSLNVQVSLFNDLTSNLSVPASTDWQFEGIGFTLWAPCYYQVPVEAVVLMGNYSLADLPRASNVSFYYGCMEDVEVHQVTFQAMSSRATIFGTYQGGATGNQTLGPFDLSGNFNTTGYWNMTENVDRLNTPTLGVWTNPGDSPVATPFSQGIYTIAVCDQWGDVAILHVTVKGD